MDTGSWRSGWCHPRVEGAERDWGAQGLSRVSSLEEWPQISGRPPRGSLPRHACHRDLHVGQESRRSLGLVSFTPTLMSVPLGEEPCYLPTDSARISVYSHSHNPSDAQSGARRQRDKEESVKTQGAYLAACLWEWRLGARAAKPRRPRKRSKMRSLAEGRNGLGGRDAKIFVPLACCRVCQEQNRDEKVISICCVLFSSFLSEGISLWSRPSWSRFVYHGGTTFLSVPARVKK